MLLVLIFVLMCLCVFALIRNNWIYHQHVRLIRTRCGEDYLKYWSYMKMLRHFWIWDIDKMMNQSEERHEI